MHTETSQINTTVTSIPVEKSHHLLPNLRFKGFRGNWEIKKVKEISSKLNVGFVGTCEPFYTDSSNGVLLVRTGNLKGVSIELNDEKYVTKDFHEKNLKSQVFPGDLLLARHGGNGEICMVPENFIEANCLNIVILRTNESLNGQFFQLVYGTSKVQSQIFAVTAGSTQGVINTKAIGKLNINFPTLPEQQKIASFLTAVDTKLQQLNQKKELLEQYKKGVMQQIFCQQLRFKKADGSDYADWEEKKLGEVCEVNPRSSNLPEEFIYIDLESVENGILKQENSIKLTEAPSRAQRMLKKNDILYQTVRPYQMNNLFFNRDGNYIASTGYAQLRAKEVPMFLFQLMHNQNFVNKVIKRCTGTSFPAINSNDLSGIRIGVPSKEEQQQIANYLAALDAKIESVVQQIEKTQEFKKGLLQQMFV